MYIVGSDEPEPEFPARASPSYEASEPSRAELGPFNFRAEIELTIDNMYMYQEIAIFYLFSKK